MSMLAAVGLLLAPGEPAITITPALSEQTIFIFSAAGWDFSCHVERKSLQNCDTQINLGDVRVEFEDRDVKVAISVSGGCLASGNGTVDIVQQTVRNEWEFVDPQQVSNVAVERVNARRMACGLSRLAKEDEQPIELAAILLAQLMN